MRKFMPNIFWIHAIICFFIILLNPFSKVYSKVIFDNRGGSIFVPIPGSARTESGKMSSVEAVQKFNSSYSYGDILEVFDAIRSVRFIDTDAGGKREIPWFYLDDGCYIRAELAKRLIEDTFGFNVKKIFLFGGLRPPVFEEDPVRVINWGRFHVAIAMKTNNDEVYVLDPSVFYQSPLTLDQWLNRISSEDTVMSVCNADTYRPENDCAKGEAMDGTTFWDDVRILLNMESLGLENQKIQN